MENESQLKWNTIVVDKIHFTLLFWLQVPVYNPQAVQMIQSKSQFCEVEFHIFLCKHNLIRTI